MSGISLSNGTRVGSSVFFLHFYSFLGFFLPFQSLYFSIICFRFQAGSSVRVVYNFSSNNTLVKGGEVENLFN